MRAYSQDYLNDVVENQGKLFDFVAQTYPDKDTEDFIKTYMASKTRKSIDEAKAYVNTMNSKELWEYFTETEKYSATIAMIRSGVMRRGSLTGIMSRRASAATSSLRGLWGMLA